MSPVVIDENFLVDFPVYLVFDINEQEQYFAPMLTELAQSHEKAVAMFTETLFAERCVQKWARPTARIEEMHDREQLRYYLEIFRDNLGVKLVAIDPHAEDGRKAAMVSLSQIAGL
jgi:hypothetical protein